MSEQGIIAIIADSFSFSNDFIIALILSTFIGFMEKLGL